MFFLKLDRCNFDGGLVIENGERYTSRMPPPQNILVVDDESQIRALLSRVMSKEGFVVQHAENGDQALSLIQAAAPDLVILDFNLPGLSGKDVCRRIRRDSATMAIPIIMITGCSIDELPADCLDSGADDYVCKPFNTKELIARVKAVLRRPRIFQDADRPVQKGMVTILPEERRVLVNGNPTERLTPKEFELLHSLVMYSPRVLDKNTLSLKVWGQTSEILNGRTLDVHVRRIRSKLGASAAKCLVTVPATGFQWVA